MDPLPQTATEGWKQLMSPQKILSPQQSQPPAQTCVQQPALLPYQAVVCAHRRAPDCEELGHTLMPHRFHPPGGSAPKAVRGGAVLGEAVQGVWCGGCSAGRAVREGNAVTIVVLIVL